MKNSMTLVFMALGFASAMIGGLAFSSYKVAVYNHSNTEAFVRVEAILGCSNHEFALLPNQHHEVSDKANLCGFFSVSASCHPKKKDCPFTHKSKWDTGVVGIKGSHTFAITKHYKMHKEK